MILDHADDIAMAHCIVETEQQVGRAQVEEMQGMRLQGLAEVHQPANLLRSRRKLLDAHQRIRGLGGSQVMAHRANAAKALHQHRHFPVGPSLDEFLEAAEFDNMQACLLDVVVIIQQQGDLAVPLDPRQRLDHHPLQPFRVRGGFQLVRHHASSALPVPQYSARLNHSVSVYMGN